MEGFAKILRNEKERETKKAYARSLKATAPKHCTAAVYVTSGQGNSDSTPGRRRWV